MKRTDKIKLELIDTIFRGSFTISDSHGAYYAVRMEWISHIVKKLGGSIIGPKNGVEFILASSKDEK